MIKPRKAIQKMESYEYPAPFEEILRKIGLKKEQALKLNYNEPTFPVSPKVRKKIIEFVKDGFLQWYPEADFVELRKKLSKYSGVNENQIFVGNGSDEIIKVIVYTFMENDEEVIIPIPNYSMYRINAEILGAKIVYVECNDDLQFDVDKIIEKITPKTKLIFISNPNSPIGNVISRKNIVKILEKASNSIVPIDEAYFEYYGETVADLINKYENLIVIRTFSKVFGLASMRIGYALTSEKNVNQLNKVRDPESVDVFAQISAVKALNDLEYYQKYVDEIKKSRDYLSEELRKLGLIVYPSKANFVLARFSKNASLICKKLEKKGIFLKDTSKISKLENCLRIAIPLIKDVPRLVNGIEEVLR